MDEREAAMQFNTPSLFDCLTSGLIPGRVIFLTCTVRAMYKAISAPTVNPNTYTGAGQQKISN